MRKQLPPGYFIEALILIVIVHFFMPLGHLVDRVIAGFLVEAMSGGLLFHLLIHELHERFDAGGVFQVRMS